MNEKIKMILEWIRDPFGRKQLSEKHDPIIQDMKSTQEHAKLTLAKREQFPIGAMVGNPDFRRRNNGHIKEPLG